MTVSSALALVVNDYEIRGRTSVDDVRRRIDLHLVPFLGDRRLAWLDESDVQAYTLHRQGQGAQPGTIDLELAALHRAFRLARVQAPEIRLLRPNNARRGFFTLQQVASVLSFLPDDIRPVVQFASITGWRVPSEVLVLEWRNVDLRAGEVRLDTSKNGAARTFPFTAELRTLLEHQRAGADRLKQQGTIVRHVFTRDNGTPIRDFRKSWTRACQRAGCPGRVVHDLRRTAVRGFVRAGIPQSIAMTVSGHKTASVFARYNITDAADLRVAVERLDASGLVAL